MKTTNLVPAVLIIMLTEFILVWLFFSNFGNKPGIDIYITLPSIVLVITSIIAVVAKFKYPSYVRHTLLPWGLSVIYAILFYWFHLDGMLNNTESYSDPLGYGFSMIFFGFLSKLFMAITFIYFIILFLSWSRKKP